MYIEHVFTVVSQSIQKYVIGYWQLIIHSVWYGPRKAGCDTLSDSLNQYITSEIINEFMWFI